MKVKPYLLSLLMLLFFNSSAFATVITLDGAAGFRQSPNYTEGDFRVFASCSNCTNDFAWTNGWGSSGIFLETWNTSAIFTLVGVSGQAFDFTGFDVGWYNNNTNNASWNVRAYDSNNIQIGGTDNYTGHGHINLNYTNVFSIEIQSAIGCCSSFDNLVVSSASVPEPATLALMGLGLAGLGFRQRKQA